MNDIIKAKEIKSVTDIARGFPKILKQLKSKEIDRVVVVKNNKAECIILSVETFSILVEAGNQYIRRESIPK